MINSLRLKHFKCFENQQLTLKPLTVLTGTNASGKSSFIHSVTLLHQSAVENPWGKQIYLNGEEISLGTANDVIDKVHGRREIEIEIYGQSFHGQWILGVPGDKSVTALDIIESSWGDDEESSTEKENYFQTLPSNLSSSTSNDFLLALEGMTYISAERLGPRETHPIDCSVHYANVGPRGERTIWYLSEYGEMQIEDSLQLPSVKPQLIHQVEARMRLFFPGFKMQITKVENTNLATLGLMTDGSIGFVRPQNIGFGLSYTLPIFTACLGASSSNIVMIENPEAHLHPQAQSLMGEFLADVAANGVQLIIETHSDHIINGIRKVVKNQRIDHDSVALHFFQPRESKQNQVVQPRIEPNGNIRMWPEGFFDQIDKDLDDLLGI